jgi:hypothetical protein
LEGRGRKIKTLLRYLLVITGLLIVPQISYSQDFYDLLEKGTQEIGVETGYGRSFQRSVRVDTVPFNVHWGRVISKRMGSSWYEGCWEVLVEGNFNYLYHKRNQYGIGVTGLVRYNFARKSAWVPYVQGGMGVWHSNIDLPKFPNDFNLSPQAGIGLQYFICPCMSWRIEYRIQHFSNAGTRGHNSGLNFNNVLVGVSWYY